MSVYNILLLLEKTEKGRNNICFDSEALSEGNGDIG